MLSVPKAFVPCFADLCGCHSDRAPVRFPEPAHLSRIERSSKHVLSGAQNEELKASVDELNTQCFALLQSACRPSTFK